MSWTRRAWLVPIVLSLHVLPADAQGPPPEDWLPPRPVELQVTYDAGGSGAPAQVRLTGTGDLFLAGESTPPAHVAADVVDRAFQTAMGGCEFLCPMGLASVDRHPDGRMRIHIFENTTRDALEPAIVLRVGAWTGRVQGEAAHQAVVIQIEGIPVVREWLATRDADS